MATLYADENYPDPVVKQLRAMGHDVLTARSDGRANQKIGDPDVLLRAILLGRAVITEDRKDYVRLHRLDANHTGIIVTTPDSNSDALAARIDAKIAQYPTLAGQLIKVYRPSTPRPKRPPP